MSIKKIIIAFDFGTKNIGVAIGQKLTCTARPLDVLQSTYGIPNWKYIENIINEWNPTNLIVGLPLKINGKEQHITILSKKFAIQLKRRFNITVNMHDERFTTVEARLNNLQFRYNYLSKFKKKIDSIAAVIILQSWLHKQST